MTGSFSLLIWFFFLYFKWSKGCWWFSLVSNDLCGHGWYKETHLGRKSTWAAVTLKATLLSHDSQFSIEDLPRPFTSSPPIISIIIYYKWVTLVPPTPVSEWITCATGKVITHSFWWRTARWPKLPMVSYITDVRASCHGRFHRITLDHQYPLIPIFLCLLMHLKKKKKKIAWWQCLYLGYSSRLKKKRKIRTTNACSLV